MSIFGTILDKIFHHSTSTATAAPTVPQGQATSTPQPSTGPTQPSAAPGAQKLSSVDVEAVLTKLAATKGGGGNWQTSIVDLLKLLDLDSSLAARKDRAQART